ncbi:hypothetical protein HOB10_00010 [Candidatus Parcubacteria bacterium]|jgi:transcription elongation factor GreA|nr:hypothetical protein [Candidatus Parcubacteria bacterium]
MRVPIRKAGKFTYIKPDPYITQAKFDEFTANLKKLKENVQPRLIKEVKTLALMGDFSENAAYQIAKGKLRGVNQKILELEKQVLGAKIIKTNKNTGTVKIGHLVTVKLNNKQQKFRILGSSETNPTTGVISHKSPLGLALLNKKIEDIVEVKLKDKIVNYKIIKIE